jgi:predicted O-methyltransferase YrrM
VTPKFTPMSEALQAYAIAHSTIHPTLEEVASETDAMGDISVMQMAPEQGALTTLLVRAIGATNAIEIGSFTGYGTISIAAGLPEQGHLIACEVDPDYAEIIRRNVDRAGLGDRVEIRVGPALETLRAITDEDRYDFAFIDADKPTYPEYYEEAIRLLRPGGIVMVDNVFRNGTVIDDSVDDDSTTATRALNDRIASDDRVQAAMIGVADGITLALKL